MDGQPQLKFISKEESSFLSTVYIYALVILCAIDVIEERKVVTYSIPGAFLQVDWSDDIDCNLKLEGVMVDIICDIDIVYKKNVLSNNKTRKKKLFGKLTKAVYYAPQSHTIVRGNVRLIESRIGLLMTYPALSISC